MPRRLRVQTNELGPIELYVIYDYGGKWESEWLPLQGEAFTDLFTTISKKIFEDSLLGWSKPLVDALGIPPVGALRKLPSAMQQCGARNRCPLYDKVRCVPSSPKMPWCYEAGGVEGQEKVRLASEVIELWRQQVYVVVVLEEPS